LREEVAHRSPQTGKRGGRVINPSVGQAQGKDVDLDAATLEFQHFSEDEVVRCSWESIQNVADSSNGRRIQAVLRPDSRLYQGQPPFPCLGTAPPRQALRTMG